VKKRSNQTSICFPIRVTGTCFIQKIYAPQIYLLRLSCRFSQFCFMSFIFFVFKFGFYMYGRVSLKMWKSRRTKCSFPHYINLSAHQFTAFRLPLDGIFKPFLYLFLWCLLRQYKISKYWLFFHKKFYQRKWPW
jgi:hypothetical protein